MSYDANKPVIIYRRESLEADTEILYISPDWQKTPLCDIEGGLRVRGPERIIRVDFFNESVLDDTIRRLYLEAVRKGFHFSRRNPYGLADTFVDDHPEGGGVNAWVSHVYFLENPEQVEEIEEALQRIINQA